MDRKPNKIVRHRAQIFFIFCQKGSCSVTDELSPDQNLQSFQCFILSLSVYKDTATDIILKYYVHRRAYMMTEIWANLKPVSIFDAGLCPSALHWKHWHQSYFWRGNTNNCRRVVKGNQHFDFSFLRQRGLSNPLLRRLLVFNVRMIEMQESKGFSTDANTLPVASNGNLLRHFTRAWSRYNGDTLATIRAQTT